MLKHHLYVNIKSPQREIFLCKEQMLEHHLRIGFLVTYAGKELTVSDYDYSIEGDKYLWHTAFETIKVNNNEFDKFVKDFEDDGWRVIDKEEVKWLDFEGGYI